MNGWTKFYGFIGLASTLGKNGFAVGEKASGLAKNSCHYIQKVVEIDAVVVGPVFKKLENAFESIESFDKSAKEWFQEKETQANEKYEQTKRKEDWKQVNEKYAHVERDSKIRGVRINLEEDILECMIRPKKKTTYLPCLNLWRA